MTEELFHVEYEDGDEEDMDTQEVTEAIALAAARREDGHDSRGRNYKAETQLPTFAKCVVHRMFSGVPSASRTQPRSEGRERR